MFQIGAAGRHMSDSFLLAMRLQHHNVQPCSLPLSFVRVALKRVRPLLLSPHEIQV